MTDAFSRLLLDDSLEPGPEPPRRIVVVDRDGVFETMADDAYLRIFPDRKDAEAWANRHLSPLIDGHGSIYHLVPEPAYWAVVWLENVPIGRASSRVALYSTYEEALAACLPRRGGEAWPPFPTLEGVVDRGQFLLPCYEHERGAEGARSEALARIETWRTCGEWDLEPHPDLTTVVWGEDEWEEPDPDPIEPAGDLVPEDGTPQAAPLVQPGDGVDWRVGDTDLEWEEIVPFLRGWALTIIGARVESATRTWVWDAPDTSGLASIVLVSTTGPGRVTLLIRRTSPHPQAEIVVDPAMLATAAPDLEMQGNFMQAVGDATVRLNAFIRTHLTTTAGVRTPG